MSGTYVTNSSSQVAYIPPGSNVASGVVATPIPVSAIASVTPQPTGPTWTPVKSSYPPYK